MADTGQSVCDCIQNSDCWNQWFWMHPPYGCCGCCDQPGGCGTCDFIWTERTEYPYLYWAQYDNNCYNINAGHYRCRCSTPTYSGVNVGDMTTTNCDMVYITPMLFRKGTNLIGVRAPVQRASAGCGSCGSQVRQKAAANAVRKEVLATPKKAPRKLF